MCWLVQWLGGLKPGDYVIAAATLLGPILAVQIQKLLDRGRERDRARRGIFHALMRTRADPLSDAHVNALNAVPIEFYGQTEVNVAFNALINHTYTGPQDTPWVVRRNDLLMELLHKMALSLNLQFTLDQLKREFYRPQWQNTVQGDLSIIRGQLAKLLNGDISLPLEIKKMPGDPEVAAAIKAVLLGERALKTERVESAAPDPKVD